MQALREAGMQLYIGNKNYSSWSLRGWLALTLAGVPFEEVKLRLDFAPGSAFKQRLAQIAPTGRVPVLVDDGFAVWDTLAIVEYANDKLPQAGVWPADRLARARARSLCAEMHAGFFDLRSNCPMNLEADLREVGARLWAEQPGVQRDVERIEQLWAGQLAASGGPFLFGAAGAVDAFFAPVAARIRTYGLPVSAATAAYVQRLFDLPAMQAWVAAALAEHDFIPADEPYRSAP
jgi:glutathione S-transferase